jgi:hypothetical protein
MRTFGVFLTSVLTAAGIGLAAPAYANPDALNSDDYRFMQLLENRGLLFNFKLQRYQAQRYCGAVINGQNHTEATKDLIRNGGYTIDVGVSITTAAGMAYCPCADHFADTGQFYPGPCGLFERAFRERGFQ